MDHDGFELADKTSFGALGLSLLIAGGLTSLSYFDHSDARSLSDYFSFLGLGSLITGIGFVIGSGVAVELAGENRSKSAVVGLSLLGSVVASVMMYYAAEDAMIEDSHRLDLVELPLERTP